MSPRGDVAIRGDRLDQPAKLGIERLIPAGHPAMLSERLEAADQDGDILMRGVEDPSAPLAGGSNVSENRCITPRLTLSLEKPCWCLWFSRRISAVMCPLKVLLTLRALVAPTKS